MKEHPGVQQRSLDSCMTYSMHKINHAAKYRIANTGIRMCTYTVINLPVHFDLIDNLCNAFYIPEFHQFETAFCILDIPS